MDEEISGVAVPSRKAFTVTQINKYLKANFDEDLLLRSIRISGEISNFTAHSAGHLYFTLKDADGALKGVMFRNEAQLLDFRLSDGMAVIAEGSISVYLKTGQYQLYVRKLEPAGAGDLHLRFEALKAKLMAEGLFDPLHKRAITQNPSCIGVITSETGAAVRDILSVIRRRNPLVKIVLFPVPVQGENAALSIAEAIEDANALGHFDTLIVGRGGGSVEDLWAFNEEVVARGIYHSKIPVISAVGHETDFTIADFTADLRAATPSVSAELAVPVLQDRMALLAQALTKLTDGATRAWQGKTWALKQAMGHRAFYRLPRQAAEGKGQLIELVQRAARAAQSNLERQEGQLDTALAVIEAVSPVAVLRRGYTATYRLGDGTPVGSVKALEEGDRLKTVFADGTAVSQVVAVEAAGD